MAKEPAMSRMSLLQRHRQRRSLGAAVKSVHVHDARKGKDEPARSPVEPDGGEVEEEGARGVEE